MFAGPTSLYPLPVERLLPQRHTPAPSLAVEQLQECGMLTDLRSCTVPPHPLQSFPATHLLKPPGQ